MLSQKTNNVDIVRYYLANAYSHLDREAEAIEQYRICLQTSKNLQVRRYSTEALKALQKTPGKIIESSLIKPDISEQSKEAPIEKDILQNENSEIAEETQDAEERIKEINNNCDNEIDALASPAIDVYDSGPNQDVKSVRNEADQQIKIIKDGLARHIKEIKESAKRRMEALESMDVNGNKTNGKHTDAEIDIKANPYIETYQDSVPLPPAVSKLNTGRNILKSQYPIVQVSQ